MYQLQILSSHSGTATYEAYVADQKNLSGCVS